MGPWLARRSASPGRVLTPSFCLLGTQRHVLAALEAVDMVSWGERHGAASSTSQHHTMDGAKAGDDRQSGRQAGSGHDGHDGGVERQNLVGAVVSERMEETDSEGWVLVMDGCYDMFWRHLARGQSEGGSTQPAGPTQAGASAADRE